MRSEDDQKEWWEKQKRGKETKIMIREDEKFSSEIFWKNMIKIVKKQVTLWGFGQPNSEFLISNVVKFWVKFEKML